MADYIFTMESRLSPEQMRAVNAVQEMAQVRGWNLYLTGGAVRDILTGFPIHDLDFTVQGEALELEAEVQQAGGTVDLRDSLMHSLHVVFPGAEVEISMARSELFDKPGKPPKVSPATITEDLRRRDFTCNAMALSLNEGSRGLLLDPFNGAADIEALLLRTLHSYAFLEDPVRLLRVIRFAARFGWQMDERTRARYDSAVEGAYIQYLSPHAIGYEIEQIAYEEDPLKVLRALEAEGWLKVLSAKWTAAKSDTPEMAHLLKTRQAMLNCNLRVDAAPAQLHFLTAKLGEAEVAAIVKQLPHHQFVADLKRLDNDAKELSHLLASKEATTNSGTWRILSEAKPEAILYLDVTTHSKHVEEKILNFLGKWRQLQEKIPLAQMAELRITPQLPEYPQIYQQAFMLLLDGQLRTEAEIHNFLAPFEPPPPPPPPPPVRRSRLGARRMAAKPAAKKSAVVLEMKAEPKQEEVPAVSATASPKPVAKPAAKTAKNPVAKPVAKAVPTPSKKAPTKVAAVAQKKKVAPALGKKAASGKAKTSVGKRPESSTKSGKHAVQPDRQAAGKKVAVKKAVSTKPSAGKKTAAKSGAVVRAGAKAVAPPVKKAVAKTAVAKKTVAKKTAVEKKSTHASGATKGPVHGKKVSPQSGTKKKKH